MVKGMSVRPRWQEAAERRKKRNNALYQNLNKEADGRVLHLFFPTISCSKMPNKKNKLKAWNKAIKRFQRAHKNITIGQSVGGCPQCGHLCSFNKEEFHCYKCGWDWKNEKKKCKLRR